MVNPGNAPSILARAWRLLLAAAPLASAAMAGGPVHDPRVHGGETVVVYNRQMPGSQALAEYYAAARGVPAGQLVGLDLPTTETITRAEFRERLQEPLLELLRTRGWFTAPDRTGITPRQTEITPWVTKAQVRFLTLCYGVPLKIARESTLMEPGQNKLPEPLRRNEAAVDSELAFLPAGPDRFPVVGPLANPAFGQTNLSMLHPTNGVWTVGRIDAPTAEIARAMVDRGIEAETNGLWGRAYIDLRGLTNTPALVGDQWLAGFADVLRRTGYETIVDMRPETFSQGFPLSQVAFYAGWYDPDISGPFTRPEVEFMPGAIAYHVHSFNASSLRTDRRWAAPLLAKGATATLGSVEEPYLELTPNLATFAAVLIGFGYSFGEAALAAQPVLSWQNTVVGDPLYRPFGLRGPGEHVGTRFTRLHENLAERQSPLLAWAFLQIVNFQLASGMDPARLASELEQHATRLRSSILQEKVAALYFETGKLGDALRAYEKALALESTPQQRIRLLLNLAQLQGLYGREQQALEQYDRLFREFPDYPEPLTLYRLMLPLAENLQATERIRELKRQISQLSAGSAP